MELTELRHEIDRVDTEIIALLEERFDIAARIADHKAADGLPVKDEKRETEKLRAVREKCRPETSDHIAAIFRRIMAESRAYQEEGTERRDG